MSGATSDLLATLTAAEACLRAVAVEALPPSAVLRVERASSRAAERLVAELVADRTCSLPAGWAEFVEVDEQIDALLARLAPVVVERRVVAAPTRPAPAVHVQTVFEPQPATVEVWDADDDDPSRDAAPEPSWVIGLPEDASTSQPADDEEDWDGADDDRPSYAEPPVETETPAAQPADTQDDASHVMPPGVAPPAAAADAPPQARELNEREARWKDAEWLSYEEQAVPEVEPDPLDEEDDDGQDIEYVKYVDPLPRIDDAPADDEPEPLPVYAAVEPTGEEKPKPARKRKEPAPPPEVARKAPEPEADPAWSFVAGGGDADEPSSTDDAYALLRKERMRLDDFEPVAASALDHQPDPGPLPDVEEDEDGADASGDLPSVYRAPNGPAAIQLDASGGGRALAAEDEPEDDRVIELGDTRDYGDEDDLIEDDQTGILGVGVVEYEEFEEVEEVEEPQDPLHLLPGAPDLTPAEVSALIAKAAEVGRRRMAEGAALYGDVLDAAPDRVDAMLARGRLYLDLGDFPGAISDFLKAEALQPRDPEVQVALGDLFYGRKDYGKAVSYFNRALSIDNDHAVALARRGMALYYRKQYSAAVEDLERAKQLDPKLAHVDTYLTRARKR